MNYNAATTNEYDNRLNGECDKVINVEKSEIGRQLSGIQAIGIDNGKPVYRN